MKRLAIVYVLCLWALAITLNAKAANIYVVNQSSVADSTVQNSLPSFQQALDADFGPVWGADPTLLYGPGPGWTITLTDQIKDVPGAAGYHGHKAEVPFAIVGMKTKLNWQLVFSHELFEMLVDPYATRAEGVIYCNVYSGCETTTFYLQEVCDPVEWSWFKINGVIISDFVTNRWYDGQGGQMDFLGLVKHSHQLLHGGFAVFNTNNVWANTNGLPFRLP